MPTQEYYELSANTLRGLDNAQDGLYELQRKTPRPSPDERLKIQILINEVKTSWEKVYQETLAASQGVITVAPPTQEDVDKAKEIADKLDRLVTTANQTNEIVGAATDILKIWQKTNAPRKGGKTILRI